VLDVMDSRLPPGEKSGDGKLTFLLGSDEQGRDMVSAIVYGIRTSVLVGAVEHRDRAGHRAVAGPVGGLPGRALRRLHHALVDIQLSFPPILIALILLALPGRGWARSSSRWWR
jgi:peptide/nickel transport system permease protein